MFKKANPKQNFPEMEKEIMKFWKKNRIFEKSVERAKDKKSYSFFDGPPFATGLPHYGHVVASLMKDVVPRFWTMKGFRVERRWGWDCHGLPIENMIEKEHGIKNKQDIEKLGIDKFNKSCCASVLRYAKEWKKFIPRIGRWVDMENDYKTMDWRYTESIWWAFSELYKKGLVYEGYKSMHICPRCETSLSNFEVAQGYKEITDLSVVVKFKLKYASNKIGRGAGALIYNDKNEILLVRRNEKGRRKTWALPGGKVEKNETFEDALRRELIEELGVRIELCEPFSAKPDIFEGRLFETVCFKVKIKDVPKIMLKDELEKFKWFSLNNLPKIDYPPSKNAIEIYKKNKKVFHTDLDVLKPLSTVYILAWTTTPWTLPGNVALAIDKNAEYIVTKINKEYFILMKSRATDILENAEHEILNELEGRELVGLRYEPLFDYYYKKEDLKNKENGWKVYSADFVSAEEGTGVVHIAPAFGEDDMQLGKKYNLPFVQHVKMNGRFTNEVVDFQDKNQQGMEVKPRRNPRETDERIVKYLEENNKLFIKENYKHSYPHCWRCDTPLLNYATSSWFVKVSAIKERMIENNKQIRWMPSYIKDGRFGKWLEDAHDWAVSRSRFWGAPVPIWKCAKCGAVEVIGSVNDLRKQSVSGIAFLSKDNSELNLHKPYIDNIKIKCRNCGGEAKIIGDVFDCWFESGSMPYAQWHYPFENKEKFQESFPADFIAEGLDQTRCWFYTLMVLSVALFNKPAFKNVIVNGIVLAENGQKMSKRLKNYPEPNLLIDKYGADALRYYLLTSPVMKAENLNFSEKGVEEVLKRFILTLWNAYSFFMMNARLMKVERAAFAARRGDVLKGSDISGSKHKINTGKETRNLLDKWILSELNILIEKVNRQMQNYDLVKASRPLREFVDKLSNWYIRRSRERFFSDDAEDRNFAFRTLYGVLVDYSILVAPFMPFISEEIYKNMTGKESVHLEVYPETKKECIDKNLNSKMDFVRQIVSLGLYIRAKNSLKVRQPLNKLKVKSRDIQALDNSMSDLIKDELNVKRIEFTGEILKRSNWACEENNGIKIALDVDLTEDLILEGYARELTRHIQVMRKKAKCDRNDKISIGYSYDLKRDSNLKKAFDLWSDYIAKKCLAESIVFVDKFSENKFDLLEELRIGSHKVKTGIKTSHNNITSAS